MRPDRLRHFYQAQTPGKGVPQPADRPNDPAVDEARERLATVAVWRRVSRERPKTTLFVVQSSVYIHALVKQARDPDHETVCFIHNQMLADGKGPHAGAQIVARATEKRAILKVRQRTKQHLFVRRCLLFAPAA